MRTLVAAAIVVGLAGTARAESIGLGAFLGEPTGLDIKIDLQRRSALDIVLGATSLRNNRVSYGHLTYLYRFAMPRGRSIVVPLRIGIGGALYGVTEDTTAFAARVPFELGLRFRRTPLEIYGEIALVVQLIDSVETDVDGGIGLRIYF